MMTRIGSVIAVGAAVLALAGCGGTSTASLKAPITAAWTGTSPLAGMLTLEEPLAPGASQRTLPTPIYHSPPVQDLSSIYPWAARVAFGLMYLDAASLEPNVRMDVAFVSYQGPYSLEIAIGFYQFKDDDLGGHITVVPITVGAKAWMEAYPNSVKSFLGLAVGPYLADHSKSTVEYSSTIGVDLSVGLSLETGDRIMALGMELGYTINRPSISIGGTPGEENLNGTFLKATIDFFF